MDGLYRDLKHALRTLIRRPTYGVVAVATLALGIGGTAAVSTVVHDTLLRPLPYEDEDELVWFWDDFSWTAEEIVHMRGRWDGFDGVAGWTTNSATFRLPGGVTTQVEGVLASHEFFEVLGRPPALGRTFRPGDDAMEAPRTVVVSHELWQSEMGGDPGVIGASVIVDGETRTVIGVMDEAFYFPEPTTGLWLPGPLNPEGRSGNWSMLGRLPDDRTIDGMGPELERATQTLGRRFTYDNPDWDRTRNPALLPLRDKLLGDVKLALWLTFGAAALILLMACANVAALTLGRMQTRRKELGVRAALGAGRTRIARQLLTETLVVGVAAGALGALVASVSFAGILSTLPLTDPLLQDLSVDWRLFGGAFVLSLLTAFVVGMAPVASYLSTHPARGLSSAGRTMTGRGYAERFLVVFEVAVAVVLVTGAGLMMRSVEQLRGVPPGFEPEGLLKVQLTMGAADFDGAERARMHDRIRERLNALPGVDATAGIQVPPLWGAGWNFGLTIRGRDDLNVSTLYRIVTPGYFETTRIDILRGRGFEETDDTDTERVVVVNEAFVREFFPNEEPLGRQVGSGLDDNWATIVGVAEDAATTGLREPVGPVRYVVGRQYGVFPESATVLVRGTGSTVVETHAPAVRRTINEIDPRIAVARIEGMERAYERAMGRTGQLVHLLGGLAVLGLLLGAVGVYGVVSHFVSRRTREWGVRLALGQSPDGVLGQVLVAGVGLVGVGVVVGMAVSWAAARSLSTLLYGIAPTDPLSFGVAASILMLVGLASAAVPAHRASRVDPVLSLKSEQ